MCTKIHMQKKFLFRNFSKKQRREGRGKEGGREGHACLELESTAISLEGQILFHDSQLFPRVIIRGGPWHQEEAHALKGKEVCLHQTGWSHIYRHLQPDCGLQELRPGQLQSVRGDPQLPLPGFHFSLCAARLSTWSPEYW